MGHRTDRRGGTARAAGPALAAALAFGWLGATAAGLVAAGCGGGEPAQGSIAGGPAAVHGVLCDVIVAAAKEDLAAALPYLELSEFAGVHTQSKPKPLHEIPQAERDALARGCFNQALAVPRQTTLRDATSIRAALAAGTTTIHDRIRKAEVAFQGTSSDGKGVPLRFVANLTCGRDNVWRLVTMEMVFR